MFYLKSRPILRELLREQLPLVIAVFAVAIAICWYYGYLPGGDREFPVAQVRVPIWHLVWMGFWTGYTMALVGEASGIFSLPYTMSVLQFSSIGVSPTSLITTFINPFGALLGFWRSRQWNLDLALWPCVGALLGAPIGPFVRFYFLSDPEPFKALVGAILFLMSVHLFVQITPWYLNRTVRQRRLKESFDLQLANRRKEGLAPSGLPEGFKIVTLHRSLKSITIGYWGQQQSFNVVTLFLIGFIVGIIASTLGVGGGFMLVPILVSFFGLPIYVLVAISIPFVILLSIMGLISYTITLPALTGQSASPDWAFGLFTASGAIFGAWLGAKTQRFIPETHLKSMLGIVTGAVGVLYMLNYVWKLPFNV